MSIPTVEELYRRQLQSLTDKLALAKKAQPGQTFCGHDAEYWFVETQKVMLQAQDMTKTKPALPGDANGAAGWVKITGFKGTSARTLDQRFLGRWFKPCYADRAGIGWYKDFPVVDGTIVYALDCIYEQFKEPAMTYCGRNAVEWASYSDQLNNDLRAIKLARAKAEDRALRAEKKLLALQQILVPSDPKRLLDITRQLKLKGVIDFYKHNKLTVIKDIREVTSLGIKDSKNLCEGVATWLQDWDQVHALDEMLKAKYEVELTN